MKIKRFLVAGTAFLLSLSSLMVINMSAAFAAAPYGCIWTGGGGDSYFSTAANWSGCNNAAPQPGDDDDLVFPAGTPRLTPQNDLTNPTFGAIEFTGTTTGGGYNITGFSMTVLTISNASNVGAGSANMLNVPTVNMANGGSIYSSTSQQLVIGNSSSPGGDTLALGSNQTSIGANVSVYSNVTGTNQLGVTDAGSIFYANNDFSGAVRLGNSATLTTANSNTFANASAVTTNGTSSTVQGSGSIGNNLQITSNGTVSPGTNGSPGCLTTGALTMNGTYDVVLNGSTACSGYTAITASGAVALAGSLNLSLGTSFTATPGQSFTILNNTGGSAISGTFNGQAEGSKITIGNYTFTISYVGGSGHSVVLTVDSSSSSGGASGAAATPGAPNTGLAAFTAHPFATLAITTISALMIALIARRLRPVKQ
jgi:fibronectin-binding autotransporter adhesin